MNPDTVTVRVLKNAELEADSADLSVYSNDSSPQCVPPVKSA